MIVFRAWMLVTTLVLCATACKTIDPAEASPALLTNPSDETHQELTDLVTRIYGGRSVTLGKEVLTQSSILSIQIAPHKKDGLPVMGTILDKPRQFQLLKHGASCYLYDSMNDTLYPLKTVQCAYVESP